MSLKKSVYLLFVVLGLSLLVSCEKKKTISLTQRFGQNKFGLEQINDNPNATVSVIPTNVQYIEMPDIPSEEELQQEAVESGFTAGQTVDIDLSVMSSTMIYSEVFNMVLMPDEYEGKNLKIKGNFAVYINKANGNRYYSIIIPDATACCQQGIEFIWQGSHSYPDDYPKIGQEIVVTGIYTNTTTKDDLFYNYMVVTDLEW